MNILFCSAGRRVELINEFKRSMCEGRIIVTDVSITAPAIYVADMYYNPGFITDEHYVDNVLEICKKEKIDVVTTLIDPEIAILAKNRKRFEEMGIVVLAPYDETAQMCFDKSRLIEYMSENEIKTVQTWINIDEFIDDLNNGCVTFPVFAKPRTGSGSVGARKIDNLDDVKQAWRKEPDLIVQEYMGDALDLDADVYIDTISHEVVSVFLKKKIESKIGGASKTISFIDNKLVDFIRRIVDLLDFSGPIDMDFFYLDGEYYLSEINPRFGGAYLHAYECGVDFIKLIENNVNGIENRPVFNNYEENYLMMMYDSVVVEKINDKIV